MTPDDKVAYELIFKKLYDAAFADGVKAAQAEIERSRGMSNIVERLRHWSKPDKFGNREGRADDFAEAADLIDKLQTALQEILAIDPDHPVSLARLIVRKALAKEPPPA